MNPVKFTCIRFGSGIWGKSRSGNNNAPTYRLIFVLEETVGVLDHDIIFKTDQLCDLFGNPFPKYRDVDLAQVHLRVRLPR